MKQCVSIYFFLFFILFACYAFAGTTTLTTYYPPPTAAYNKVNLSTAPTAILPTTCATNCVATKGANGVCTLANVGFNYTYNAQIYACNGLNSSALADGNLHGDISGSGNLHVVMAGGQDTVYPPECYNKFCTYNPNLPATLDSLGGHLCLGFTNTSALTAPVPPCQPGFNATPVNSLSGYNDSFHSSPDTTIVSIVCCTTGVTNFITNASAGSTTFPHGETTTTPP